MTKLKVISDRGETIQPGFIARLRASPAWSRPRLLIGVPLILAGSGWVGWQISHSPHRTFILGCLAWVAIIWGGVQIRDWLRAKSIPQNAQVVHHYHHRRWFALALLLPLVGAPQPAFADLSVGEMKDAVSGGVKPFFEELYDWLCSLTVAPLPSQPPLEPPLQLPEPMTGNHPDDMPVTPSEGVAAAERAIGDQQDRAGNAEAIIEQAMQASAAQATQLQELEVLNKAAPASIAAQVALTNEISAVGVRAAATAAQMQAANVALQASEIMAREQARKAELAAHRAWLGDTSNRLTLRAD